MVFSRVKEEGFVIFYHLLRKVSNLIYASAKIECYSLPFCAIHATNARSGEGSNQMEYMNPRK
jgi:hypothetical protein